METIGKAWVQRANSRPIGSIEFRQVRMEIGFGVNCRVLHIRTLRQSDGLIARTIFCVIEPWPLSNTNYMVTEQRGCIEPFSVQLYLPFALGTLRDLPSERRREGHLGSDFSYDDLRTWLYEEGHQYQDAEIIESQMRVRGRCVEKSHLLRHGDAPFDLWLDSESAYLRGIDYRTPNGDRVVREYRAEELTVVDGIVIAGRLTMHDWSRNHSSTIRLERAWFDRDIDPTIFEASFRKHTRDYLIAL